MTEKFNDELQKESDDHLKLIIEHEGTLKTIKSAAQGIQGAVESLSSFQDWISEPDAKELLSKLKEMEVLLKEAVDKAMNAERSTTYN